MPKREPTQAVTKASLIAKISADTGTYPSVTKEVVEAFLANMTAALVAGERIEFRNFGVFKTKTRKARTGFNPHVQKTVAIPVRRVVTFKPGLAFQNLELL